MRRILAIALLLLPLGLGAQEMELFIAQAPAPGAESPEVIPGPKVKSGAKLKAAPKVRKEFRIHRVGPDHLVFNRMPGGARWWKNSEVVQKLGVSEAQVQQIERIFQDSRMRLIDAKAALEKQEVQLEPLIQADNPDEGQITSQIEKVAAARAELEKTNALMQVAIRRVLTLDQWKKLQSMQPHAVGPHRISIPLPPPAPGAPVPDLD
ncbi:MAG TPA: periplasmic heavy metal sensor [Terriglobales bacterium]|nr:periplasmic heavy metal sensor [Terriglobales bacterium]